MPRVTAMVTALSVLPSVSRHGVRICRNTVHARGISGLMASRRCGYSTSAPDFSGAVHPTVNNIFARYQNLRSEDRYELLQRRSNPKMTDLKKCAAYPEFFRPCDVGRLVNNSEKSGTHPEDFSRSYKHERRKPSHPFRRKTRDRRVFRSVEYDSLVLSETCGSTVQTAGLLEDRHKTEAYEEIHNSRTRQWRCPDLLSDQLLDVMIHGIRENVLAHSRPVLVNEFTQHSNPYVMKRRSMRRLLEDLCSRSALDESMIGVYLDCRPDLVKLRLSASVPPEAVEPLVAFRADISYSYDRRTRLCQKVDAMKMAVEAMEDGERELDSVLSALPENKSSDGILGSHPFRNHFGFVSAIPHGVVGSISMGKAKRPAQRKLEKMRYPTLQSGAHSLPKDPIYRSNMTHVIKLLERSSGWDFLSKLRAISSLVEVYNIIPSSKNYERMLEKSFSVFRARGTTRQTSPRNTVFCRGLKYIRSLTTQKPVHRRVTKRK